MDRLLLFVLTAVVAVGCSSDPDPLAELTDPPAPDEAAAPTDSGTGTPTDAADPTDPTDPADEAPPPAPASAESCGDPATPVALGETVSGETTIGEPVHFCVEVPAGQAAVTFELDDLSDDVDLFVGHDTFEVVRDGGIGLRISDGNGTDPESIVVEPAAYRGELIGFDTYADVTPGPYWIEVAGQASTFTLTVIGTPA